MTDADPTLQDPTPPPPPPPAPGRPRFARPVDDRVIAGVSGAIANEFGIRRTWVRIGFIAVTLLGGAGIALYILAMLLIPDERDAESTLQRWLNGDHRGRTILAVIVLLVAFGFLGGGWWGWDHDHWFPGGWVLIAVGVLLLVGPRLDRDRRSAPHEPPQTPFGPGVPPPPAPPAGGDATTARLDAPQTAVAQGAASTTAAPTFDPEVAARAAERAKEREARSARRWRRFMATIGSLLILTVVATGVAVTTGALPLGWGWGDHNYRPASMGELQHYRLFAGEQEIDLSRLQLRDGAQVTIKIDQRFGRLHVILPSNARAVFHTHVRAGENNLLGERSSGFSSDEPLRSDTPAGWNNGPTIVIDARLTAGNITIDRSQVSPQVPSDGSSPTEPTAPPAPTTPPVPTAPPLPTGR